MNAVLTQDCHAETLSECSVNTGLSCGDTE